MSHLHQLLAVVCLALPAAALAATGPAEDDAPAGRIDQTIVVTAGDEERAHEAAAAVGTVAPAAARGDQAAWIGETVTRVPGVYLAQLRGPTDAPSIRYPVSFSSYYLFLQDNLPFQSPILYNHGALSFSAAETSFGGIEVLRGPGTALHGSAAIAAVINVRSREPGGGRLLEGRLAGGSHDFAEGRGEAGGQWGSHAVLAGFSFQRDGGWREHGAWHRAQGIVRHRWQGEGARGLTLNTIALVTDYDLEMSGPIDARTVARDPEDDGLEAGVPLDQAHERVRYLRLSTEVVKPLGDRTRLALTPYYRRLDGRYLAVWFPDSTPRTEQVDHTLGLQARVYRQGAGRTETVAGLDVERTTLDLVEAQARPDAVVFGFFESPQGTHYDYAVRYLGLAPYLQHTQGLGEKAALTLGLRWDAIDYDYDNRTGSRTFGSYLRPDDRSDRFSSLDPKLGLSLFLTPRHTLYGRYAHSFRIPAAADLYQLDTGQAEGGLDPETIDSVEFGWKGQPASGLRLEATAYHARTHDGITTVSTPAGELKTNGGSSQLRGLELGLGLAAGRGLEVEAAYAFSSHRIRRLRAGRPSPEDGNVLPGSPEHLLDLRLEWRPAFAPRLRLAPGMMAIGDWYLDHANTETKGSDAVFNLRAGWELRPGATVTLKVLNLLDRIYPATAEDAGFGATYRLAQRRTAVVGLDWQL